MKDHKHREYYRSFILINILTVSYMHDSSPWSELVRGYFEGLYASYLTFI